MQSALPAGLSCVESFGEDHAASAPGWLVVQVELGTRAMAKLVGSRESGRWDASITRPCKRGEGEERRAETPLPPSRATAMLQDHQILE